MRKLLLLTKEEKRLLFVIVKSVKDKNDKYEEDIKNGKKLTKKSEEAFNYTKDLAKGLYKKLYEKDY